MLTINMFDSEEIQYNHVVRPSVKPSKAPQVKMLAIEISSNQWRKSYSVSDITFQSKC